MAPVAIISLTASDFCHSILLCGSVLLCASFTASGKFHQRTTATVLEERFTTCYIFNFIRHIYGSNRK